MKDVIPLVISVVGHRDPRTEIIGSIKESFRKELINLMRDLPSTPIWLLTGLAEGADQIAAEVFIDIREEVLNSFPKAPRHKLIAVLPKRESLYLDQDFTDTDSKSQYLNLLNRSDQIITPENCNFLRGSREIDLPEPDCYARQSSFLVRYCYILIAFSNGVDNAEGGGTAQSVAMQLGTLHRSFHSVDEIMAVREPGALIEINTPRYKNIYAGSPRLLATYWLENQKKEHLSELLSIPRKIETINHRILNKTIEIGKWDPFESALWRQLNSMAINKKNAFKLKVNQLFLIGFLISLCFAESPWQILGLLVIAFAYKWFPNAQNNPKQSFVLNRSLAESVTIQKFWIDFDIGLDVADLTRINAKYNLGWVSVFLRSWKLYCFSCANSDHPSVKAVASQFKDWFSGEIRYMRKTIKRYKSYKTRLECLALITYLVALIGATLSYAYPGILFAWFFEIGLALSVLIIAFLNFKGYEEISARYERSISGYEKYESILHEIFIELESDANKERLSDQDLHRLKITVEAIGREKIDETNDWLAGQLSRTYSP